jgi:hypothetical protein
MANTSERAEIVAAMGVATARALNGQVVDTAGGVAAGGVVAGDVAAGGVTAVVVAVVVVAAGGVAALDEAAVIVALSVHLSGSSPARLSLIYNHKNK